ncbi:MAG: hypothetical protein GY884_29380 [Proteobacteria bacterium]|nr:hypothetical protein [Pseudomonadota bacterium]
MTLVEVMVAAALLAVLVAVAVPSLQGILDARQTGASKQLALTYRYLRDEAALRNVTFRFVYYLDQNTWTVEVGDPDTMVFTTPEARADFEDEIEDDLKRYTQREIEEGEASDVTDKLGRFAGLSDPALEGMVELPTGVRFAWVWTPQYGEPVEPSDEPPDPEDFEEDPGEVVYSYIFADGTAEQTLVRIADVDDDDDGYTLEVEPLSGRVTLHDEVLDYEDLLAWLPDEGPELPR